MGDLFSNLALGFHVVFQFVPWSPAWLGVSLIDLSPITRLFAYSVWIAAGAVPERLA